MGSWHGRLASRGPSRNIPNITRINGGLRAVLRRVASRERLVNDDPGRGRPQFPPVRISIRSPFDPCARGTAKRPSLDISAAYRAESVA